MPYARLPLHFAFRIVVNGNRPVDNTSCLPVEFENMASYEFGFLLEQALGHVTHAKNLLNNIALDPEVRPHWGLVHYEAKGIASRIPVYRSNWTVRAGVRAHREIA